MPFSIKVFEEKPIKVISVSFLLHLHCKEGNYIKTIYAERESGLHEHVVNVLFFGLRVN